MKKAFLIGAVILILVVTAVIAHAQEQATVVMEGEDVIQTVDGKIYVGQGVSFNGNWITLFNVRFPVLPDNKPVGAATFPAIRVKILYHKGPINMQGATTPPNKQSEVISDEDAKAFNTW